jgi:hypothetical protein
MKTFLRNLAFGLILGLPLLAIAASAAAPAQTQKAVVTIVTTVTDVVAPIPSPTPLPTPTIEPTVIPTIVAPPPAVTPIPEGPQPFPPADQIPQTPAPPPAIVVGATPAPPPPPVVVPQTMVFVQIVSINGVTAIGEINKQFGDPATGGYKGTGPLVVGYQANFQGGFPGIPPQFTWGTGQAGQTITATYNAGRFVESVKVQEVYQGVTYQVGSANAVVITVS